MKQIGFLLFLLVFTCNSYSQNNNVTFQISTGATLSIPKTSKLASDDITGVPEIKTSIAVGAYILPSINFTLKERVTLDLGLGYYLDRFAIRDETGNVVTSINRNINQIQTPISINFSFGNDNSYKFGLGGFSSFLLSANAKGEQTLSVDNFSNFDNPILDPLVEDNRSIEYNENIEDIYNSISLGAFIELRKNISFSSKTNGFLVLKINQYFNSIKNIDENDFTIDYGLQNEKEPTTVNLGVGIIL